MAASNMYENGVQWKACRCGEGDTNIWTTRTSDNPDKQIQKCPNCHVLKSGPLFLSSKGIGWTSWKKRWFVLTRTSLVFYRSDPNANIQKGGEANLTLGGIDLNNSGSVVVKADKKLLTVLFPDGRDGRTFTLKAETSEDLYEWRTALENALVQAPSPAFATGQTGILQTDVPDSLEASFEQWKDRRPAKSLVIGRPILLALEDIDGSPSFLEKALRFIEEHGIKVEGILRQSADVEEVERRVREYEEGIVEFTPDEDAHVVGDCIKHVLRELPSSPVPATCCTALVEAYRTDRGSRIASMRAAIADTFPEPNRRLVQRILKMMLTVSSHKAVNRMTLSAVAACMAPLLLRPLLAGDCELEDDFNMGGDGSLQLLQAAAAANHAQAIVIILLEEYERIFDVDSLQEGSLSSDLYSESEDGDVDDDELTDNDILDEGYNDLDNVLEADIEDDQECSFSGTPSEDNSDVEASDDQDSEDSFKVVGVTRTMSNKAQTPLLRQKSTDIALSQHGLQKDDNLKRKDSNTFVDFNHEPKEFISDANTTTAPLLKSVSCAPTSSIASCTAKSNESVTSFKRRTVWGRTPARKNLSMESIDFSSEDEIAIQRLEVTKNELQTKITKEIKENEILQASLEKRKELLHEHRLALEQDVKRLKEQLQREVDLKMCLEAGLMALPPGQLQNNSSIDGKTKTDLEELAHTEADIDNFKQMVTDLSGQLSHQLQHSASFLCESCSQQLFAMYLPSKIEQQKVVGSTTVAHQKENSVNSLERSTSEIQNTLSSGLDGSEPTKLSTITKTTSHQNKFSINDNSMLGTECENLSIQTCDSPSTPDAKYAEPPNVSSIEPTTLRHNISSKKSSPKGETEKKEQASKNSIVARGSSDNEPTTIVRDAPSKMSSSKDEDRIHGPKWENMITQSQYLPSSPDNHSPQKPKTKNRSNKPSGSNSSASCAEEQKTITHDASSKKSSLKDEKSLLATHGENVNIQDRDSPSSPDSHSPPEFQPSTVNQSSTRPSRTSVPSTEEPTVFLRSTVSKRSSRSETLKREAQDPQSLTNKQRSLSRSDQTATSTSSALAKLTNRLNFLKERRLQLAHELQNLDATRTSGPEGPSRTSSRSS